MIWKNSLNPEGIIEMKGMLPQEGSNKTEHWEINEEIKRGGK